MENYIEAGIRINDFKIIRTLGTGGMGIVYLANQTSLNRFVALKVLGPTIDDPKARARFRRESRAVALLKHPGIAEVHYAGQDDALCYMATEYIEGATLRQVFDRAAAARDAPITFDSLLHENEVERRETRFDVGPEGVDDPLILDEGESENACALTPAAKTIIGSKPYIQRCCLIVRDAALALEHAHRRGVVHRDVKPQNLMLDRQGGVHVIDFGVARFRDDVSLSQTGALVGTPMYMSPEHISGRVNIDHRSDIFSLGIVLYEALTLRPPHSARTREGIFRQIVSKAMPPVSTWNRSIQRPLEAVVHKAIARDPEERYPSAEAFSQDLQNVINNHQVTAKCYIYNFDTAEIVAERPMSVLIAAGFAFIWGTFAIFLGLVLSGQVFLGDAEVARTTGIITASLVFMFGLWMYWTTHGLLKGRRKSILAATIANTMFMLPVILSFVAYTFFKITDRAMEPMQVYFGAIALIILMFIFCLNMSLLYRPRTRRWFQFAQTLRAEYERHNCGR